MDKETFKKQIEKFVSEVDPIRRIHEQAIIANAVRLTLAYPELAREYFENEPAAVQECNSIEPK